MTQAMTGYPPTVAWSGSRMIGFPSGGSWIGPGDHAGGRDPALDRRRPAGAVAAGARRSGWTRSPTVQGPEVQKPASHRRAGDGARR